MVAEGLFVPFLSVYLIPPKVMRTSSLTMTMQWHQTGSRILAKSLLKVTPSKVDSMVSFSPVPSCPPELIRPRVGWLTQPVWTLMPARRPVRVHVLEA